ncbi:hypothetical protein AAY473_020978, partial [Plecturocebus cupreus]
MHHHAWLIFAFLVEMGFLHVGQADLELPTSGDPPTLTSQSAGITNMIDMSSDTLCPSFLIYKMYPFGQCNTFSGEKAPPGI